MGIYNRRMVSGKEVAEPGFKSQSSARCEIEQTPEVVAAKEEASRCSEAAREAQRAVTETQKSLELAQQSCRNAYLRLSQVESGARKVVHTVPLDRLFDPVHSSNNPGAIEDSRL